MSDVVLPASGGPLLPKLSNPPPGRPNLDEKPHLAAILIFSGLLLAGVFLMLYGLIHDVAVTGAEPLAIGPFVLLAVALLLALGFEFVNGFHDTANAVATVIYTHALPAHFAVIWSGSFNLLGVLASSGAVAFGIVSLLPVELILQVGSSAGYDMIFALLIAAIVWNLGTWWLGLPASSSHTLVGSIIGVGVANQLMAIAGSGTSGVDWGQAGKVFSTLLISPVFGFVGAAILLLLMKLVLHNKTLYAEPDFAKPPPRLIRGTLILTCTLVSFFHGSNDGQKGMGLIMLILIGALPTAYALNRTLPESDTPRFIETRDRLKPGGSCRAPIGATDLRFGDGVIVFEGAVHHRAPNLEHQVRAAGRPSDLLLGIQAAVQQPLHRALGDRCRDWLLPPSGCCIVDDDIGLAAYIRFEVAQQARNIQCHRSRRRGCLSDPFERHHCFADEREAPTDLSMPEPPADPLDRFGKAAAGFAFLRRSAGPALGRLGSMLDAHREMKPI